MAIQWCFFFLSRLIAVVLLLLTLNLWEANQHGRGKSADTVAIVVCEMGNQRITQWWPGQTRCELLVGGPGTCPELEGPQGVALDEDGSIWVTAAWLSLAPEEAVKVTSWNTGEHRGTCFYRFLWWYFTHDHPQFEVFQVQKSRWIQTRWFEERFSEKSRPRQRQKWNHPFFGLQPLNIFWLDSILVGGPQVENFLNHNLINIALFMGKQWDFLVAPGRSPELAPRKRVATALPDGGRAAAMARWWQGGKDVETTWISWMGPWAFCWWKKRPALDAEPRSWTWKRDEKGLLPDMLVKILFAWSNSCNYRHVFWYVMKWSP